VASDTDPKQDTDTTFAEAVLGKGIYEEKWAQRLLRLPPTVRLVGAVALFAGLLFLPYLGAVGLWDPWETHYGEVGRSMVQRSDYVFPFWENAWFFSKPPMTMWLQALGMNVVGALREPGALSRYTEWGMRLPFALLSITALCLLAVALSRLLNRRVGLAAAFVLATMPLYFLLTRQTVTDTPFVTTLVCGLSCALIGQLDGSTRHRTAWWYAFYVFCGISALSKGVLGLALPAAILGLYFLLVEMPYDGASLSSHVRWLLEPSFRLAVREGREPMPALWAQFFHMRLLSGLGVFLAVCGPWYLTLHLFEGVDDESKRFWYRFWIHDHINRLASGVHTTTPGGTFTYFIEQGGFAIFPWVAALPGALALVTRLRLRGGGSVDKVGVLALLWAVFTFTLVGASATKFHHYVFPVLPGVAILIALFIDRLWEEGISAHAMSLLLGLVLFVLVGKDLAANPKNFTDLFVYNYERPYPTELVTRPIGFLASRPLWLGDVLAVALLAVGLYLVLDAFGSKGRSAGARVGALLVTALGAAFLVSMLAGGKSLATVWVGVLLGAVAAWAAWEAMREKGPGRSGLVVLAAGIGLVAAAALAYGLRHAPGTDRLMGALAEPLNVKKALGLLFTVAGVLATVGALQRSRVALFGTFWALAASFALWFGWSHWVDLSHHWTQRDLFWRYYEQRQPGEPIAAFLMNWRGETFYSRNQVKQIPARGANERMRAYAAQPGREWALVEHNRINLLRNAVGTDKRVTLIDRDLNNKFVLVTID
jgi:4-amino-4-deoxy-L-arabinose transferase-like glycosyltransferase